MGLFDLIFGNSKRTDEDLLENKHREEKQTEVSVEPFVFKSNCHQRYEDGAPKMGLQECLRTVIVLKNTIGCSGYQLAPGVGYIVKLFNDDLGKPTMADKPMKVVRQTNDIVELRGFPIEAQSPFGWQKIDLSEYGLVVYYENGEVVKCRLHMYDRNTYIEYLFKNGGTYSDQELKYAEKNRVQPLLKARTAFREHDYLTALHYYQEALAIPYDPTTSYYDAQIISNMGMAYSSIGNYQIAFQCLKKAQSLGLNNSVIENELLWLKNNVGIY
jgi:hypothetical protein